MFITDIAHISGSENLFTSSLLRCSGKECSNLLLYLLLQGSQVYWATNLSLTFTQVIHHTVFIMFLINKLYDIWGLGFMFPIFIYISVCVYIFWLSPLWLFSHIKSCYIPQYYICFSALIDQFWSSQYPSACFNCSFSNIIYIFPLWGYQESENPCAKYSKYVFVYLYGELDYMSMRSSSRHHTTPGVQLNFYWSNKNLACVNKVNVK